VDYVRIGVGLLAAALAGFYLLRAKHLASTPRARAQQVGAGRYRLLGAVWIAVAAVNLWFALES
jgi:UPF0716 family protein affecting phage T7 exclusion